MVIDVNGQIGHHICLHTEDILVVRGIAGMFTQGNTVSQEMLA